MFSVAISALEQKLLDLGDYFFSYIYFPH